MANMLSVLAFVLAFAAIWFAAAMQYRIERMSQDSLKAHVRAVQEATRTSDDSLADLKRRIEALERDVRGFRSSRREDAELLAQLARRTQELRIAVSARPPAPAAQADGPQPAGAAKPNAA